MNPVIDMRIHATNTAIHSSIKLHTAFPITSSVTPDCAISTIVIIRSIAPKTNGTPDT